MTKNKPVQAKLTLNLDDELVEDLRQAAQETFLMLRRRLKCSGSA